MFKFAGAGNLRLDTTGLNTNSMGLYGIARRTAASPGSDAWIGSIVCSSTSTPVGGGALLGLYNYAHAVAFPDADAAVAPIAMWDTKADIASIANDALFSWAVIPFDDAGTRKVKVAVRPWPTGTLYTATYTFSQQQWTNPRVAVGGTHETSHFFRGMISQVVVRNVSEPADADINAYFDNPYLTGSTVHSSISGNNKATLQAALVDESGNSRNWTAYGNGISLDDTLNPTLASKLTLTGTAIIPEVNVPGTGSGVGGAIPAAPSGLAATRLDATRVKLTYTDNSSDEVEFVAQTRYTLLGVTSSWVDAKSAPMNVTTMTIENLVQGAAYEMRVRAQNQNGQSGYSNTTTLAAGAVLKVRAYVHASAVGKSGISVAIFRPKGAQPVHGAPCLQFANQAFEPVLATDPSDGKLKAVIKVRITDPGPDAAAAGYVPLQAGESVLMLARQGDAFGSSMLEAKVIEE